MSFSVLMSLYAKERPDYLRQSLESIFNQTMSPDEVIVVEDGPLTEELYQVLDEYAAHNLKIKRIVLIENRGLGCALNEGLKHCSHDIVARMDTDDICFSDRFEKQIKYMLSNPEVDVASGWLEEFNESTENIISIKCVPASHTEISTYIKSRNPFNHPAVIFRKSSVERVGGYKHFPLFEDWYLWARMFRNGAIFGNIQEPLLYFRTSPDMYKRRGGWKYAKDSMRFQWTLHKLGIISSFSALKSSILRCAVYLMPNSVRGFIYTKFLRTK